MSFLVYYKNRTQEEKMKKIIIIIFIFFLLVSPCLAETNNEILGHEQWEELKFSLCVPEVIISEDVVFFMTFSEKGIVVECI